MNSQEIYKLASELTEQEVTNLLGAWGQKEEKESVDLFHRLVQLGDSRQLAMATCIAERYEDSKCIDLYRLAYQS